MNNSDKWSCPLPYVHMEIQPAGDIFVCCHSLEPKPIGNLHKESLSEIWNSKERLEYEHAFEQNSGAQLEHCRSCKKLELEDAVSGREKEIIRWNGVFIEPKNRKSPKSMAIRYSNLCNLKCRSCKPSTSTAWFADAKLLNPEINLEKLNSAPKKEPISSQIGWFLENGLEKIYFAGGEALLEPDHYKTLEKIIEINPAVEITYDTNFSVLGLGKDDVLVLWSKLQNITVSASIDGADDKCEYLRSGLKWKTFLSNWEKIKKQAPKVNIKIHYTVSLYNIFHFPEFLKNIIELGIVETTNQIDIGMCEDPMWLNIRSMPPEIKEDIKRLYDLAQKTYLNSAFTESFEEILSYLAIDYDIKYFLAFGAYTKKLDTIRNEHFSDAFPNAYNSYRKFLNI